MKAITTLFLAMLIALSSMAQDRLYEDQLFEVQNHSKDYFTKDYYTFGKVPKHNDAKFITSESHEKDESMSYNGIVVSVYFTDNIGWADEAYRPYRTNSDYGSTGEYRFDWMMTETEVDMNVVDDFIDFMEELPEEVVVCMYSGYYHGIDQMPLRFYEAVELVYSHEIRNLSANSVWACIGSKCPYDEVAESYSNDADAMVNVSFRPLIRCSMPTSLSETSTEDLVARVFPNPANSFLSVTISDGSSAEVLIYDLTGQVQLVTRQMDRIDISELPKGIYIVQVKTAEKTFSSRITKK